MPRRIALAADTTDSHARALLAAFTAQGADARTVRLALCDFNSNRAHGIDLPGFGDQLPDAVLVREIAGGSFEEVTRRLGVLHALRELGVPIWNDARAVERCVDKSMTSFVLARAGVPTPSTWAVEGRRAAEAVVAREAPAGPLVQKPLFGSQGRGLRLVAVPEDLAPPEAVGGVYYLQRYIPPAGPDGEFVDHRLFVCDGAVIAAMSRRSARWITNVHRGGRPEPLDPPADFATLALAAVAALGADYAGVDLIRDATGQPYVLEVNSMPAWKGLQQVNATPIAERLAAALLARLG
jgi:RimK family alpha-L-glutamate ligase